MYRTILGEKVSRARWKQLLNAQKNRQQIIKARLGVAFDGLNLWVANNGNNNVMLLRPSDARAARHRSRGGGPFGVIAAVGLNGTAVWTANFGTDTVSMIGP